MTEGEAHPTQELLAQCYGALHVGTPGDVQYYQEACAHAHAVLELGVGSGRILAELNAPQLSGLDVDGHQLRLARSAMARRGITAQLIQGDMASFDLERSFERVIVPYNGLLCLSEHQRQACLQSIERHLSDSGQLIFDFYSAEELHADAHTVEQEPDVDPFEFLVELEVGARHFQVFEQNQWWPSEQRLRVVYELRSDALPPFRTSIEHHYLLADAVAPLLAEAGLAIQFEGVIPNTDQRVVTARRG